MNIFDIVGPVMVGPSSSHTAGAVRIGYIAGRLLKEPVQKADILLHGSFLATGKGHGTDRALIAGLLGMHTDDSRIPDSFKIAAQEGLQFHFSGTELRDAHPNSVRMELTGNSGRQLDVVASSLGGGRIQICEMDGMKVNFCGEYPTLIVYNSDQPGQVTEVTSMLAEEGINIAAMQLYRDRRCGNAVMIIECDGEVSRESIACLEALSGIRKVTFLSLLEEGGENDGV